MVEYDFCDCCSPTELAFAVLKTRNPKDLRSYPVRRGGILTSPTNVSLDGTSLEPDQEYFTSPEKKAAFMRMIAQAAAEEKPLTQDSDLGADTNFAEQLLLNRQMAKAKRKSKPFHGYNPNKHARTGGLNAKGRAAAKRKTGANLKRPVTKKPSKLKPGGKAAKRRKSFCARMGGMKGPTSKGGKLTPKGAALKRWNC
tara:strand:+ start:327 stop:920 length:594 start_codon:yes stop_codon:yes gene_type:complete